MTLTVRLVTFTLKVATLILKVVTFTLKVATLILKVATLVLKVATLILKVVTLVLKVATFTLKVASSSPKVAARLSDRASAHAKVAASNGARPDWRTTLMPASQNVETFDLVFSDVRKRLRLTIEQAATRLDVSKSTLERWLIRPPSAVRGQAIVEAFPELPRELRARLAASLGTELPAQASGTELTKAALEGALFEAAESLNAPARDVRRAFAVLLARVAALGIDVATASAIVSPPREP